MLARKILAGDLKAAAQLMRDIDNNRQGVSDQLKQLHAHTGRAHIIGVTGPPGAGKSTLIDRMIHSLRLQGKSVGVLAVDPSSPYSGGAILGDRIRLQHHADDPAVFIKSIATRGHMGGISQSVFGMATVMDAMGKAVILVETVGVGQDEVDISRLAHTVVVVITTDMGEGIQAVKSGVLEIADIYALNKTDKGGSEQTMSQIKFMLGLRRTRKSAWEPAIVKTNGLRGEGVDELLCQARNHFAFLHGPGMAHYRKQKLQAEFMLNFRMMIEKGATSALEQRPEWHPMLKRLVSGQIDPCSAAREMVDLILK